MSGQIFISYRREESRWSARSLHDRLCRNFNPEQIFMDIDAIALGEDFVKAIEITVAKCDVLIAVIGERWLTSADERGCRRLDYPNDFVRMEIAAALKREISVIPVLVDGASMPKATDLPEDLQPLVRRNALKITDTGFDGDCQRLATRISAVLEKAAAAQQPEADKSSGEPTKLVHPLPPKAFKPDHEEPLLPLSGGTAGKSPSKQEIAYLAITAVLVVAGLIYLATKASHPPSPSPPPLAAVTPSPATIATPLASAVSSPTNSTPQAATPSLKLNPGNTEKTAPTPQRSTPKQSPAEPVKVTPEPTASPPQQLSEGKHIDYFFGALPPQDFTASAALDLLQIIKSGRGNIFDLPNGYMYLKGNGAQVSLQIALFLYENKRRPFLAIAWGNLGGADFTHLSFFNFNERDGRMVPANRAIFPVQDSDKIRFELPREGQTVKVLYSSGKVHSEWAWNSHDAKFECTVAPKPEATASLPQQLPEGKQIDYFFSVLPPQDFTTSAPSDLLQIIKSGRGNIFDLPNGYMYLKGNRAQVSLQIALFLYDNKRRPLLAIAWGNLGGPDFTHLSFFNFNERDGRMVATNRAIFPIQDSDKIQFELPREGQTVKVSDSGGEVRSKWSWNPDRARFEKDLFPRN
jgi:hypothetical protein